VFEGEKRMNKHKRMIIANEKGMSNKQLLDEVIELAAGDDYDGCFTDNGKWAFKYLKSKLYERLADWLELSSGDTMPDVEQMRPFSVERVEDEKND